MFDLPQAQSLNVNALSRTLDDVTNSYKYIFFLALLEVLARNVFDATEQILLQELATEMLVIAWYPHTYFRLSFGRQDRLGNVLDQLGISPKAVAHGEEIRRAVGACGISHGLEKYVPYRLLRPFFDSELRGAKDGVVNGRIACMAEERFVEVKPLYRITGEALEMHPEWLEYIKTNYRIVTDWVRWNWLNYMQRKNPNTPALSRKLFLPARREAMSRQKAYWQSVVDASAVYCIYSGKKLESFALDHYVPWSFVVHNELWNLVPTLGSVNSQKSDAIPAEQYLDAFVELQHHGLRIFHELIDHKNWLRDVEPYLLGLNISNERDLLDVDRLRSAYRSTIPPLIALARAQGFASGWVYTAAGS